MYYYEAHATDFGWQARVYHWDASGNKQIFVYKSDDYFDSSEEAQDDASQWCEDNNFECEMS